MNVINQKYCIAFDKNVDIYKILFILKLNIFLSCNNIYIQTCRHHIQIKEKIKIYK